jgi:hypothetical protein
MEIRINRIKELKLFILLFIMDLVKTSTSTQEYMNNIIVSDNFLTDEELKNGLDIINNGSWKYKHNSLGENLYEDDLTTLLFDPYPAKVKFSKYTPG